MYDFETAVARIRAAREALDATAEDVMLVGRADGLFYGETDMAEIVRRIAAFAQAGADCLYAPGVSTPEQIRAVVKAAAPKPVNVLMGPAAKLGFDALADLGVRRISVGGALALAAWSGFTTAVDGLAAERFDGFAFTVSHAELGKLFG
ncbi:MAG: isocitrate lyase/phosphoenolpyruvate mutase family protein, partial [Rhodanobacteraceae bacterium]